MGAGMTLEVDKSLVAPVIREQIRAAIVRELGATDDLVRRIVAEALNQKVSASGKPGRYQSDNKYTYLQWLSNDIIKRSAREAAQEYVMGQGDTIKKEVSRQIKSQSDSLAQVIVDGVIRCISTSWAGVRIVFNTPED